MPDDLYPGEKRSAQLMAGPKIGTGAQIGVNVTILPFVHIRAGVIIAADSMVTQDIPAAVVAYGNPAVACCRVADLPLLDSRVVADASSVSPYRLRSGRGGGAT
jgi:carbonic anhydrase/acetyltransferase-like protein (isoleucine patch superfamily)